MANKPKIYARCVAGCEWETVHYQDFLDAATHIKVPIQGNRAYLSVGEQYKIFSEKSDGFSCSLKLIYKTADGFGEYIFEVPDTDVYSNHFIFKLLEAEISETGTTIRLVYEISGIRYYDVVLDTDIEPLENGLVVDNATKVFRYNDDASFVIEVEGDNSEVSKTYEDITIESWTAASDVEPYKYSATITSETLISDSSIVELINDNAISFAKYGFAIGSISGQEITFYAIEQPTEEVTLKIMVEG